MCYVHKAFIPVRFVMPTKRTPAKMSAKDTDQILISIENLHIDDSKVNKMRRRRSARIQEKNDSLQSLDISFDFANNNWLELVEDKDNNKDQNSVKIDAPREFELELENVHYLNAKKQFTYITRNEYRVRRSKIDTDDCGGDCGCQLTTSQIKLGILGCGAGCLNRMMSIECDANCKLREFCSNQRFQKFENAPCAVFITEKKGYGLFASKHIPKNTFIMEFVGEVVSMAEFKNRSKQYAKQKTRHCYVMTSAGNKLIDATKKGNLTRFANHSCDPNAETQKWTVNGEGRIGIFSRKAIEAFEEITINYQFERFG